MRKSAPPDGKIEAIAGMQSNSSAVDGTVVRIVGLAADITERKLLADELLELDRRFRELLGNVGLISVMLDTEARITYCNDYLLQLVGWARAEVLGLDWFQIFVPSDARDVKATFTSLINELPKGRHHENEILTRSGVGEVIGAASIGEDITEQRRYQLAHQIDLCQWYYTVP